MMPARAARVLLVDDRRENLVALEAILQGLPIETVAATSGEEALKRLLVDDFAVILLDAQMPGMDGFETASHVKQRERTRHIPIIFLTGLDRDAYFAFRGYAVGAVDYITKPFDPWVLRAKVSVFVDLWAKNELLRDQAELTRAREREHEDLLADLAHARKVLEQASNAGEAAALRAAVTEALELLSR